MNWLVYRASSLENFVLYQNFCYCVTLEVSVFHYDIRIGGVK